MRPGSAENAVDGRIRARGVSASRVARDLAAARIAAGVATGLLVLLVAGSAAAAGVKASSAFVVSAPAPAPLDVPIFLDAMIHFSPDSSAKYATPGIEVRDRGRIVSTEIVLPADPPRGQVKALLTIKPIPQDERSMFDRWDRAGSIRLAFEEGPDVELVRFITAYGGRTDHEVDVTALAPLLRGPCRFRAFIDTWVTPAWRVDCSLRYEPDSTFDAPFWAAPVMLVDSFNREEHGDGLVAEVTVPPGLSRVVLRYISTGHCTDGRDADEFESKANVISVDGRVVARIHPWRDDCRRFRERNPYCSRWADGSWSSDYARSGWCPGVEVLPTEFDLTDHLGPGKHQVKVAIEEMRPEDADGNFGYWRVSAALIGWDRPPRLWRN